LGVSTVCNSNRDLTIQLNDGRRLGFAEYGDPSGAPVFYFNGSGGSRLEHPADESLLTDLKVRFIATDRPGHGLSDPQPRRALLGWPDDVGELADQLGIDSFRILGWSAGGPHALACGHKLRDRVLAGSIVGGLAPPELPAPYRGLSVGRQAIAFILRKVPRAHYVLRRGMDSLMKADDDTIGMKLIASFPQEDRALLEIRENRKMLISDLREGYRQGWRGPALDDIAIFAPWGFRIQDIRVRIDVWQGDVDRNVPLHHGEYQAKEIPSARLRVKKGDGHLFLLKCWREVLQSLLE
jgi:pimeloyl-ACP methyl ester carboxylesterase